MRVAEFSGSAGDFTAHEIEAGHLKPCNQTPCWNKIRGTNKSQLRSQIQTNNYYRFKFRIQNVILNLKHLNIKSQTKKTHLTDKRVVDHEYHQNQK